MTPTRLLPLLLVAGAFASTLATVPATARAGGPSTTAGASTPAADDTLYRALGGSEALVPLMHDFVERSAADPRIGPFFRETNLKELKKQLVDQLCEVSGGPCRYEGATMADAHADMRVGRADFLAMVELLQASMDRAGIAFAVQRRLLARLAPMHRDIVNVR